MRGRLGEHVAGSPGLDTRPRTTETSAASAEWFRREDEAEADQEPTELAQHDSGHRPGRPARAVDDPHPPLREPARLDDPRFSHRSRLEWGGTASYGQDPEEFLGSPTDDDNEWRGGSAFYE